MSTRGILTFAAAAALAISFAAPARAHVVLNAPDGGEVLTAETTFQVEWLVGNEGSGTVTLQLSTDGGGNFATFASQPTLGGGAVETYDWTVPNVASTTCRVKVLYQVTAGPLFTDTSDSDFTILPITELHNEDATVGGFLDYEMHSPGNPGLTGVLFVSLSGSAGSFTLNPGGVQIDLTLDLFTIAYLTIPALSVTTLDGVGDGGWFGLPVPNNPNLVGIDVWAAAAVFHLQDGEWHEASETRQDSLQ
jgi:hypothetical protein